MKDTLKFLTDLSRNNNKEWFDANKGLASRLVDIFHGAKPFLDYINRAIDYCREEKREYFSSLVF